jgi:serine/threonine-protein kinase
MTHDSFVKIEELLKKETAGDYQIMRMLGRGGMAVVYLAREVHLARNVAIKVLPPELTFGHGVERFKREAKTAAALDHPNIIPIYRVSAGGSLFWYAMKFLEGESLEQLLKERGKLPLDESLKILGQVAEALDYAHEHQVVHRDMKPANVMLDNRRRVIVTDFGIAKALSEGTLTASGSVIGTPYFMSPEQGMGKTVTGASDQYSVGVMAYRMLAGKVPFEGDSAIDVLHKHCMVQPPPLETAAPGLPRHVYLAVHRSLDKNPERRFPTVSGFIDALRDPSAMSSPAISLSGTAEGEATLVVSASSAADLATTPIPIPATSVPGTRPAAAPRTLAPRLARPSKKKAPAALIAGLVVVLGGGAAAAVILTKGGQAPAPATRTDTTATSTVAQPPATQPSGRTTSPPSATPQQPTQTPAQQPAATQPPVTQTAAPPQPQPSAPRMGTLVIQNLPRNGSVLVDGTLQDGTAIRLEPGRHEVELVAAGMETHRETIMITANQTSRLRFAARPLAQAAPPPTQQPPPVQPPPAQTQPTGPATGTGILLLGLNTTAQVFVDGDPRGTGRRLSFAIIAGSHAIRLVAAGYRDTTHYVQVPDRDTVRVIIDMQRQ